MVLRVNGGIITDQMLTGGLRFFKLSSAATDYFANTISTYGEIVIPGAASGGRTLINEVALFQTIVGQDETDFASFVGGSQYNIGEILIMSDGSIVRVDLPNPGPGAVTGFTVIGASKTGFVTGTIVTQVSSTSVNGGNFTMTTDAGSEAPFVGDFYVAEGQPVPNSVADRIFALLADKATIVIVNQIDDNNIHFACDDSGFGWDSPAAGDAAAEMLAAIKTMGPIGNGVIAEGDNLSNDPPVPNDDQTGLLSVDLDVGDVTLTETTPFELT